MDILKNKVLIVEDSPTTQKLIGLHIKHSNLVRPIYADSFSKAKKILEDMGHDQLLCAVLDLNLPDAPNGEIVDYVQDYDLPIIILTSQKSIAIQKTMEAKNVIDYVVKKHVRELEYINTKVASLYLNQKMTVLVVDDSPSYQKIIQGFLENLCFKVMLASSGQEALDIIKNNEIGLTIIDYHMKDIDGIELTELIREKYLKEDMPIIGISGKSEVDTAAKFLKMGASDYMYKPLMVSEFYCRIHHNVEMLRNIRLIKKSATTDFLTNISNRREFFCTGEKQYQKNKKESHMMLLAMIDADYFKQINDKYGHDAGDAVLMELANTFKSVLPDDALIARFGGEEFTCLANIQDEDGARDILETLRSSVEGMKIKHNGNEISVTISIGVSTAYGESFADMVKSADAAVYAAKDKGRNRIVFDTEIKTGK